MLKDRTKQKKTNFKKETQEKKKAIKKIRTKSNIKIKWHKMMRDAIKKQI